MKKKFLFFDKALINNDLYEIFNTELKKASKFELNFFEKDSFRFEDYYPNEDYYSEKIFKRLPYKDCSICFYYLEEQEITFRDLQDYHWDEIYYDIFEIFDKRKINKCFNYNIQENKIKGLVSYLVNKRIINLEITPYEKETLINLLEETIKLDKKFYNNIENSLPEIRKFNEKVKNLTKNKKENKSLSDLFPELSLLEKKYCFLNFDINLVVEKAIKLNDVDFSQLSFSFSKESLRYDEPFLKKNLDKSIHFEEFILDETFNNFILLELKYFNEYLNTFYEKKLLKKKNNYSFSKYLRQENLIENYFEAKKGLLNYDYNYISEKIWEKLNKSIRPSLIHKMIYGKLTFISNNDKDYIKEIFQTIFSDTSKEKEIDFRKSLLIKHYSNILDNIKKEILDYLYRNKYSNKPIQSFFEILTNDTYYLIFDNIIGLYKILPKDCYKYFQEEVDYNRDSHYRSPLRSKKIFASESKFSHYLDSLINILNDNDFSVSYKETQIEKTFNDLNVFIINNINPDLINIKELLKIIYNPIEELEETFNLYFSLNTLVNKRSIIIKELNK